MKPSKKLLALVAVLTIIGSGIYIYSTLQTTKAYSLLIPQLGLGGLKEKILPIDKFLSNSKSAVEKKAKKEGELLFAEAAQSFKNAAFSNVKEGINIGLDKFGEMIGVEQNNQEVNKICQ